MSIDLIYRFDPKAPLVRPAPADAAAARHALEEGNRRFAKWTDNCVEAHGAGRDVPPLVMPCSLPDLGIPTADGLAAKQAPFAVLVGCSDARVPAEIIFGQLRNNLFVVRVAGNVLSDECMGSIEYAVHNLRDSIRLIVVLGHTSCGAVAATVDTYLNPWAYLAKIPSPALRSIVDRLFVPVRKAATALETIWGPEAARTPGYRDALLDTAVAVNALQSAYYLRQEMQQIGRGDVEVVYGIFDLVTHRIWTAAPSDPKKTMREVVLAEAPATLQQFEEAAMLMANRAARRIAPKK
jgi:carbonic anhydrase